MGWRSYSTEDGAVEEAEEAEKVAAAVEEQQRRQREARHHKQLQKLAPTVLENPIATTAGQLMDTGL